ncbi:MAG: hypothetical protein VX899_27085 [Myxococcota bacterium]|nr:hypothetical protein [Myxococcota bacterium]
MRRLLAPTTLTVMALFTLACALGADEDIEGDVAGECSDGADNDADGYFDCDDNDCWGAPDCDEDQTSNSDDTGSGGDDTGSGGDDTGNSGDPVGAKWTGLQVVYTLEWEFTLPVTGLSDCTQVFEGSGTQTRVDSSGPHFDGTWELVESDCEPALDDAIWTPDDGEGVHSVELSGDDGPWTAWWVRAPSGDGEFGVYDFTEVLESGVGRYQEDEAADAAVPGLVFHHDLELVLED